MSYFPIFMICLFISIFIIGILLLVKILPNYRRTEIQWLMAFIVAVCIVSFCSLNIYVLNSFEGKILFSRLRYIGYGMIAQTWFFFLFINFTHHKIFKSPFLVILFILQMSVTVLLAASPDLSHWVVKDFELIHLWGVDLLTFKNGPWFTIHVSIAYLCAIISLLYAIFVGIKSNSSKRKQLFILSVGGFIGFVIDAYCVVANSPLRWGMFSAGFFLLAEFSIYYAIIKHDLLNLSSVAKDQIFNTISDALIILDNHQNVIDANNIAKERFQVSTQHLSMPLSTLEIFKNIDLNKSCQEIEIENLVYRITSQPLNRTSGTILVFQEITLQNELMRSLNKDLDFKGQLLSMITHDFSGVLNTQSYLSSVLEKEVSSELKEKAAALKNSSLATRDMMSNILLWAKSQQSEFIPIKRPFELNILLKDAVETLEAIWSAKNIQIILSSTIAEKHFIINGDAVMIESAFRNILTNAIRASSNDSIVEVKTHLEGSSLTISVQDYGKGINPEKLLVLKSVSNQPIKEAEGFGIGILISKRFMEVHDGRLEIESTLGQGTLVSLTFPI